MAEEPPWCSRPQQDPGPWRCGRRGRRLEPAAGACNAGWAGARGAGGRTGHLQGPGGAVLSALNW